jgi:hypothetical protein
MEKYYLPAATSYRERARGSSCARGFNPEMAIGSGSIGLIFASLRLFLDGLEIVHYADNSLLDFGVGDGRGFTPLLLMPKIFTPKWHSETLVRFDHRAAVNDPVYVSERKFTSVFRAKLC